MERNLELDVVMTNATQRGGAERLLQHLYRNRPSSLRLRLCFLEDGPMVREARDLGIEVEVVRTGRFLNIPSTLASILAIRRWIRRGSPDLVLGWMKKSHLYASPAAAGIAPSAWFQHENPGDGWIDRLIHRLPAAGVLCCSDFVRSAQQRATPARRCWTVHPCQDAGNDRDTDIAWPVPEGRCSLTMVCRLQSWKGPHLAVEALARLGSRAPDVHLVVVGGTHELEPDYPERLRTSIRQAGLEDRVHLVGFQPSPASWMRRADVVVHASDREPFGMVVAEAVALGIPVVAARPGGPEEIVGPDEGHLWTYPDIDELCSAIQAALGQGRSAPRPERLSVGSYLEALQCSFSGILGQKLNP